jgi:hypothetical protein
LPGTANTPSRRENLYLARSTPRIPLCQKKTSQNQIDMNVPATGRAKRSTLGNQYDFFPIDEFIKI